MPEPMLIDGLTGDARPARVRALLRLANTCARSREGEAEMWVRGAATRELSALSDEYPEQYQALFTMSLGRLKIAAAASESGDLDVALAISETEVEERRAMLDASPGEGQHLAQGLITHALLLFDDRQDTRALALLAEAQALWPESPDGSATGGRPWELEVLEPAIVRQSHRIGEYDPALARRLLEVGVAFGLAEVEVALGRLLLESGEPGEAISLLGRRERGAEVAVEELLGAAHYLIGDTDRGIALWHAAAEAGSAAAACNLAGIALAGGVLTDAEKWLGQALAADPQLLASPEGHKAQRLTTSLGAQLLQTGGVDRAMALLRLAADAGFAPAQHLLGIALMDRGDPETRVWLERAVTQDHAAAADNLGMWCFLAGDRVEAHRWWLHAHEQGVRAATYHLAILCLAGGDLGAARALLEPARDAGIAAAGVALAALDHVSGRAIDGPSALQTMAAAEGNAAVGARLVLALLGDKPVSVKKLADEALVLMLVRFVP